MAHVLIEHQVGDFEAFLDVFTRDGPRRRQIGAWGGTVFRIHGTPDGVFVLIEFDTLEHARDFAGSLELGQAAEWVTNRVSTPRVTVLEHVLDTAE